MTTSPARCAQDAAEAIRSLNHATLPSAGQLSEPADVYAVLGSLATLASRLPQALSELLGFLQHEQTAGRVQIVDGQHAGNPAAAVAALTDQLSGAANTAEALQHTLEQAHATITWAARTDPARTDPARTDPARTDPARTDPARTDPARTDPED